MASSSKKSNIDYSASSPLTLSMESSILRQQSLSDEDQFNQSASSLITNDKTRQSLESLLLMIPKVSTGQLSHQKMIDGIFSLSMAPMDDINDESIFSIHMDTRPHKQDQVVINFIVEPCTLDSQLQ
ncbi:uncharacterized protein TRIADDRAFT_56743 [Trichoplax adhaerens]|uniref:Uncharacterized protein n=1 Tax=Trichoplax adhaerens TaxID=10228 RepID=B3RWG8_TRIAD|nr:predicted protein [Trichoplax adhaerens]EDV24690.1 predicted protein [Trichoplax adhaerens]|eukprot:XP_002112580.1 predicted protein [Trichoplax adhaerens]